MKTYLRILTLLLLGVALLAGIIPAQAQADPTALWLNFEGPLTPVLVGYVERGIQRAERQGDDLVIIRLNTPGGSIDMMSSIVTQIRESTVPVVVYVAPNGAMAGSAGTLITLAGHAAAMAPETIIGAASPVTSEGTDLSETLESKVKEALKAQARSLAEWRGPEAVKLAESAIEEAKAASAKEALEAGLVDLIAVDQTDLLRQLDGRKVLVGQTEVLLNTSYMQVSELPLTLIEQLLQLLTNPNLIFVLLSLGIQAIFIELSSPGGWVAGFIGVVAVALAIYGMGILPVNWFGIVFLILAFILFVVDVKAPSHGALTAAGIGSFVTGSLILFNNVRIPGVPKLSIPLVIGTGIFLALSFSFIISFAIKALRAPARMGANTLLGKTAQVKERLDPVGQVRVAGELWGAELVDSESTPVEVGSQVVVEKIDGVKLRVSKKP